MAKLHLHPIGSALPGREGGAAQLLALEEALRERRAALREGWGARYQARVHKKGKLTTWERIEGTQIEKRSARMATGAIQSSAAK